MIRGTATSALSASRLARRRRRIVVDHRLLGGKHLCVLLERGAVELEQALAHLGVVERMRRQIDQK